MSLKMPPLPSLQCRILTVCGKIESEQKIPAAMKNREEMVAPIRIAKKPAYLRLLPGGKQGQHLHMDCALQEFFSKGHQPETTCKKTDILEILEQLEGVTLEAGLSACFHTTAKTLPEKGLIESFATEQRTGDMSIKLTSGTLEIEGAPVKKVWWKLGKKEAIVTLDAERKEVVDDDYLVRCMDFMKGQFDLFVLGRTPDEIC